MSSSKYIDVTSGKRVHFLRPTVDEIDINDIAEGLSKICRFYGHCSWYSVAEHSVRTMRILPPELQLVGLLHDGSEAFLGDMHGFLKRLVPQYMAIERRMERVIARKYNLPYPYPRQVKVADKTLLCTEQRDLRPWSDWRKSHYRPLKEKIVPWSIEQGKTEFLREFERLTKESENRA